MVRGAAARTTAAPTSSACGWASHAQVSRPASQSSPAGVSPAPSLATCAARRSTRSGGQISPGGSATRASRNTSTTRDLSGRAGRSGSSRASRPGDARASGPAGRGLAYGRARQDTVCAGRPSQVGDSSLRTPARSRSLPAAGAPRRSPPPRRRGQGEISQASVHHDVERTVSHLGVHQREHPPVRRDKIAGIGKPSHYRQWECLDAQASLN